jgi:hypothetical protein
MSAQSRSRQPRKKAGKMANLTGDPINQQVKSSAIGAS